MDDDGDISSSSHPGDRKDARSRGGLRRTTFSTIIAEDGR